MSVGRFARTQESESSRIPEPITTVGAIIVPLQSPDVTISVEPDKESEPLVDETTRGKLFKSIIVPEAIEPVEISVEPVALYD